MIMLLSHGLQHQSSAARIVCALKRSYNSSSPAPAHANLAESVLLQKNRALNVRCLSTSLEKESQEQAASWSTWELFVSTAAVSFAAGAFVYSTSAATSPAVAHQQTGLGFGWGGGGGGGGKSPAPSKVVPAAPLSNDEEEDPQEEGELFVVEGGKDAFDVSVRAIKGGRLYMEDEYFVGKHGHFVGVFDGHGGGDVSAHLRKNLYKRYQQQLKRKQWEEQDEADQGRPLNKPYKPSLSSLVGALRQAFNTIDTEVLKLDEMQYQGSTAVAVTVHEGEDGSRTLVSANVGDSRAILCRKGVAVDLTRDHKPTDERERARIHAMGEHIEWDNYSKVHRIKNLSLSRAVGDRFAKPVVSGEAEIKIFPVCEDDDFIVLASDGLWDVMTSDQVVQFVNKKLDAIAPTGKNGGGVEDIAKRLKDVRRKNMSRYVATEALKRGSADNICVLIVWLKPMGE